MLFCQSSEFEQQPHEACFLINIYEHQIKKRVNVPEKLTKNDPQYQIGFIRQGFIEFEVIREKRKCKVPRHAYHMIKKREFILLK